MPSLPQFAVQAKRYGDVLCLTPVGELDLATVSLLASEFEAAESTGAALIVIDLGELTSIDSTGIRLLVSMDCACAGEQRLRLIEGPPEIDRVLKLARVRAHLPIIAREDSPAPLRFDRARSTRANTTPPTDREEQSDDSQ